LIQVDRALADLPSDRQQAERDQPAPREPAPLRTVALRAPRARLVGHVRVGPRRQSSDPRGMGLTLAAEASMIRGEGNEFISGVTAQEVFDFVLDPAQYTKADTKITGVTCIAETKDGMIAREDGLFLGVAPGSVITHYRWQMPHSIDVTLVRGA